MKSPKDSIGYRNHELLACNTVPEPTSPPTTPHRG